MADVLSQSQIDDLLKSFSNNSEKAIEEIEINKEKKVKVYDFRMPKKFTKERLRILDRIFENFSRLLSSYFTGLLRMYCKVNVLSIEEQRYFEFTNALPEYVLMGIIDMGITMSDMDDTVMIVQMSNPVTYCIMDRMLGGLGQAVEMNRDFTEIEVQLLSSIISKMCGLQKEAWSTFIDIEPTVSSIETNPRVIQSIPPDEGVILVLMEVELRNVKNTISICIPAINLEQFMNKFYEKNTRTGKKADLAKDSDKQSDIMSGIKDTNLEISAVLCETKFDLQDILNLQVNDIISLNKNINSNIVIKIGNQKWFDGKLGEKNNKKAVRIDNLYKN